MGYSNFTNPVAGSTMWRGIMVGRRYAERYWHEQINSRVTGDATVTADFTDLNVDVTFSRIADERGYTLADQHWIDLPMYDGGFEGEGLGGQFYGPNHEEAGGTFDLPGFSGAFATIRQ